MFRRITLITSTVAMCLLLLGLFRSYAWVVLRQPDHYDRPLLDEVTPWPGFRLSVLLPFRNPGQLKVILSTRRCTLCGQAWDGHPTTCEFSASVPRELSASTGERSLSALGFFWEWARQRPNRHDMVILSLWPPFLVTAIYPTAWFFRGPILRRWRRNHGLCPNCGYNLTGNQSGQCPECGHARTIVG